MSLDTIAIIVATAISSLLAAAVAAIALVVSVRTDVAWLKQRIEQMGHQLDAITRRTPRP
jgi:hypothetical protein